MRQRLSWDQEKVAEIAKKADPYTMNQDHKNPPVEKYDTGGPSDFAEDPDMKTPWKTEGRTETGHPAPAREAVKSARQLEDKALKCITIAQRMLPGGTDDMIEVQATELMYLPENCVVATLQRQAELAESLVPAEKEAKKSEEKEEEAPAEKPEGDDVDAGKKAKADPKVVEEEEKPEEKAAAKDPKVVEEEEKPEEKAAAKDPKVVEEEEKAAAKDPKVVEEEEKPEEKAAAKDPKVVEEEEKPEEKAASEESVDLLDKIFASEEKTGAKKLSGLVKQASEGGDTLNSLWTAPPDVSKAFK